MQKLLCLLFLLVATPALAQPQGNEVVAEQLFNQGRELAKAERWAEACPKFEASLRQDASLGTKLNLATCYDRIGKLASAWGMYREVAEDAAKAGDARRRDFAKQQAEALVPRIAKLTLEAPPKAAPGMIVKRNAAPVDTAELGLAVYVDPGSCEVEVSAPGFHAFKTSITLKEGETKTLALPTLEPDKKSSEQASPVPSALNDRQTTTRAREVDGPRTRRTLSLGIATAGLLSVGVGLGFGANARLLFQDAKELCGEDLSCSPETYDRDKRMVDRARTHATAATVLVSVGGAAIVGGAILYFTSPRERLTTTARLAPIVDGTTTGLAIAGGF